MGSDEIRQAAKEAFQRDEIERAKTLFREAAEADGISSSALAKQGMRDLEAGKLEKATEFLHKALEANPLDLQAILGTARVMMSLGAFQQAAELIATADRIDPTSGPAKSAGSLLLDIHGDPKAAQAAAKEGFDLAPDDFFCIYTYARTLARQRRDQEAIELLERALSLQPEHYGALYLLGILQTERQDWRDALLTFQKARSHHPAEAELYITIADVQWHRKQPQLAIELLEEGLRSCPSTIDIHHKLAQLYNRMEEYDNAREHLEAALEESPEDAAILSSWAAMLWEQRELDACIAMAERTINAASDTWQAHQLKAQCLHAAGQLDEAEAAYKEAQRCAPQRHEPPGQWAMLLMQRDEPKRFPEAIELFRTAIHNAPPDEHTFHKALAVLFDKMGHPHKAKAILSQLPER